MPDNAPRAMRTVRYITGIPRKPLPAGHVVVHNHVNPVEGRANVPLGWQGFRAWIAAPAGDDVEYRVVRCDCEWAPELGDHYRVRFDPDGSDPSS